ncbi:DUF3310 domain-containing protein [Streptomyces sp. NPDC085529]|uniref:DUF3310 domain-containing protein n=1 Tax=Streptomyces sp. NPDC085529 TaxID=3365729 RepID=UPI0037D44685
MDAFGLDYYLGNVPKYICRAGKKENAPRLEDLKRRAAHCHPLPGHPAKPDCPGLGGDAGVHRGRGCGTGRAARKRRRRRPPSGSARDAGPCSAAAGKAG